MSREIKFRAFSRATNKMLMNIGFHPHMCCINEGYTESQEGAFTISPEFHNYSIMQFTGLHDSKGVEIYEGDILTGNYSRPEGPWPVEWHEDQYIWGPFGSISTAIRLSSALVVGNIHEHPHLLEAQS